MPPLCVLCADLHLLVSSRCLLTQTLLAARTGRQLLARLDMRAGAGRTARYRRGRWHGRLHGRGLQAAVMDVLLMALQPTHARMYRGVSPRRCIC
eukprot:357392-Chlamydomonas_euryale.AAC.47